MPTTKSVIEFLNNVVLCVLVLGAICYAVMLLTTAISPASVTSFKEMIDNDYRVKIGLPVAAIGCYGIVVFLLRIFPPEQNNAEKLQMKFAGLEFTGPAGPVTLWVVCFLTITFAIWLLSEPAAKLPPSKPTATPQAPH
jgi:hypothetical protein